MARPKVDVDLKEAVQMLTELKGKDFEKAYKSAIRSGARVLKKETDSLFATQTNLSKRKVKSENKKIKPGEAKISFDKRTGIFKVHIMKDYMMKWFEMGTKLRVVKRATTTLYKNRKGRFFIKKHKAEPKVVGRIAPKNLFREARMRKEKAVYQAIGRGILRAIKRINNKKR